jgi:hypothetical protein
VISWTDDTRTIPLPVDAYPVLKDFSLTTDVWNIGQIEKKSFTVTIPPHDVAWFVKSHCLFE